MHVGGYSRTALQMASNGGFMSIVELLRANGVVSREERLAPRLVFGFVKPFFLPSFYLFIWI